MTGTRITPITVAPNNAYAIGVVPKIMYVNTKFNAIAIAAVT